MKRIFAIAFIVFLAVLYMCSNPSRFDIFALKFNGNYIKILDENLIEVGIENYINFLDYFDVEILNSFYIEDRLILEGYSPSFGGHKNINFNKVNVQISVSKDSIIIGTPLIYNSF